MWKLENSNFNSTTETLCTAVTPVQTGVQFSIAKVQLDISILLAMDNTKAHKTVFVEPPKLLGTGVHRFDTVAFRHIAAALYRFARFFLIHMHRMGHWAL